MLHVSAGVVVSRVCSLKPSAYSLNPSARRCTGVDGFEDACCAMFCGCCATAQMARHEFLEVETGVVRYDCCSATGE